MKYYILSNLTRFLLGKLRRYHKEDEQLLVFSKDFIGEEIYSYGVYEKDEINCILKSLDFDTSENSIVDIGANIGNHAIQFSKKFKNVYCFEPNKTVFDVLKINTRNRTNIHLNNYGISNENTVSNLNIPEGNFGGASISVLGSGINVEVQLKKFDDVFFHDFAILKIDVEGHESNVIQGMINSIAIHNPLICLELINTENKGVELIELVKSLGYTNFYIPLAKSFFFTKSSNSSFWTFINGLFFMQKQKLQAITKFEKPFYNLVVCEHEKSKYKIKK